MPSFYRRDESTGTIVPFKLTDNGDGTFTETSSGGGGGGGDASAANQATQITAANTGNTSLASIDSKITTSTATATLQNAAVANGNGSSFTVTGYATAVLFISGITTATVNFEASNDAGTTWAAINAITLGASTVATTTAANGLYRINVAGLNLIRARISGWSAGTITITGVASIQNGPAVNETSLLSTISGKLPTALGQTTKAASLSVTQASDWTVEKGTTVTTTIQNAVTANANGSTASAGGYATVMFQVSGLGVATINFEITNDNGTNWSTLSVFSVGGVIASTTTANGLYRGQIAGLDTTNGLVRARISGYSSGTITVTCTLSTVVAANKYVGSAQLPAALGQTTKANSLAVTPASDYNQPGYGTALTVTFNSISANNTDGVAAMDVSNYRSGALQITSIGGGGTIQVQFSLDSGTTWIAVNLYSAYGGIIAVGSSAQLYAFPIPPNAQMRIRTTAYTSGTITGNVALSAYPLSPNAGVILSNNTGSQSVFITPNSDSQSASSIVLGAASWSHNFNGTTFERNRGVGTGTLLASAARTTTTNSSDQTNFNWRGLILTIDISSAGTGSITPSLQYKDSVSGNYKTVWTAAAALTANGTYCYGLYPGELNTATMTEVSNVLLTRTFRIVFTANNANSMTYSSSIDMML